MPPKPKAKEEATPSSIPSRRDVALALRDTFNKKYRGKMTLQSGDQYRMPYMTKRLRTGLLTLDVELRGGFPAGGLSQIAGPKNSGKSWMYWQVIRQLQKSLGDKMSVLLAMTEMRADKGQGRLAGVHVAYADEDIKAMNRARLRSGRPELTPEQIADMKHQIGTIDELHAESAEVLFDGILNAVEVNAYHLIVIDSMGSIMSAAEAEADSLQQKTYGGSAGVTSQFLRKLCAMITMDDENGNARDTCILCVNQVRDAIGDPHREFRSPGGKALEHAKFVDLFVSSGAKRGDEAQPVITPDGMKKQWLQTGKEVHWRIEKGKAGIHEGGKGSYIYDFDANSADFESDYLVAGLRYGVIQSAGAWYTMLDESGEQLLKVCGKDAFTQALADDAAYKEEKGDRNTLMEQIRRRVYKAVDLDIDYDWDY